MQNSLRLAALILSAFSAAFAMSGVNIVLPLISTSFDVSFAPVQWMTAIYLTGLVSTLLPAGQLGDGFGPRRVFLIGGLSLLLASVAAVAAPSISALLVARAVQGLSAGLMVGVGFALAARPDQPHLTRRNVGLIGAASAAGTASGPLIGAMLGVEFGWRSLFLCLALAICLSVILMQLVGGGAAAPKTRTGQAAWIRLCAFTALIAALAVCLKLYADWRLVYLLALAAIAAGSAGWVARWSASTDAVSILPVGYFSDFQRVYRVILTWLASFAAMTTFVAGPFLLVEGYGLRLDQVGLVMVVSPAVVASTALLVGFVPGHFALRAGNVVGLSASASGLALLSWAAPEAGLGQFIAGVALTAFGYGAINTINNAAAIADADDATRSRVSALLGLARNLGLLSGVAWVSAVFVLPDIGPGEPSVSQMFQSFRNCYPVPLGLVGAMLLLWLIKLRWRDANSNPTRSDQA